MFLFVAQPYLLIICVFTGLWTVSLALVRPLNSNNQFSLLRNSQTFSQASH